MRILHLISSLDMGGAERLLVDLASTQIAQGHSVRIISMSSRGFLTNYVRSRGVEVYEFETLRGGLISRSWQTARLVIAFGRSRRDVVHSWMYHSGLLALLLTPRGRKTLVSIHHHDPQDSTMSRATKLVARALAAVGKRAGAVVYVSETARVKHENAGYPKARSHVVVAGVDARRFRFPSAAERRAIRERLDPGVADATKVVAQVARFHPDKDPLLMLAAVGKARRSGLRLRLWLVGRGMDESNLELTQAIEQNRLSGHVLLMGQTDAPEEILGGADIVASSSRTESFGLALVEGMLCGLSPAATAVGIAPLLLSEDRLAPPGDSSGLARALERAAVGDDARAFRALALQFSLDAMAERYEKLYARLADE